MHLPADDRYATMLYNRCGASGLKLPAVSLGLWHNFGGVDAYETGRAIVRRAFDRGVTHFDLANNYGPPPGSAEENFGRMLKDDLAPYLARFRAQGRGARILLKETPAPEHFGVAELVNGRIVALEEKPAAPRSRLAVVGVYFYDPRVFELIRALPRSARGELEITDVNRAWLARGELEYDLLQGWWIDAGTHASLAEATRLVCKVKS